MAEVLIGGCIHVFKPSKIGNFYVKPELVS